MTDINQSESCHVVPCSHKPRRASAMMQMLPFVLFAFVASITPGPSNILILDNSARYGVRAGVPIVLGASLGAALIVLLVGLGLGEWLLRYSAIQQAIAWCGAVWLSYLAWQIANSSAQVTHSDAEVRQIGFVGAVALQVVNPKTWIMALAVVAVFAGQQASPSRYMVFALVFLVVSIPCLMTWAFLGQWLARMMRSAAHVSWFNRSMALLLLTSTWFGLLG